MYELRLPDDFHIHLRQGANLPLYARSVAAQFGRAIVMPNTDPPITDPMGLKHYRDEILAATAELSEGFEPLMTFYVTSTMTGDTVAALKEAGVTAGKLYPAGATTNSRYGIHRAQDAEAVFEAMEELDLVLCIHGEDPDVYSLDREAAFIEHQLTWIRERFPSLRIVLEHLTSAAGVKFIRQADERMASTITLHHLVYTLDDLIGGKLLPHVFCKPIPKSPADRDALWSVIEEGHSRFFFGSDSAPHPRNHKEGASVAAGVFSSPISMAALAELFEERGIAFHEAEGQPSLEAFTSRYGAEFYGLPLSKHFIRLDESEWRVPREIQGISPMYADRKLKYRVAGRRLVR